MTTFTENEEYSSYPAVRQDPTGRSSNPSSPEGTESLLNVSQCTLNSVSFSGCANTNSSIEANHEDSSGPVQSHSPASAERSMEMMESTTTCSSNSSCPEISVIHTGVTKQPLYTATTSNSPEPLGQKPDQDFYFAPQ